MPSLANVATDKLAIDSDLWMTGAKGDFDITI
jgi:hypothetical protein